jgi:hypothetical protein
VRSQMKRVNAKFWSNTKSCDKKRLSFKRSMRRWAQSSAVLALAAGSAMGAEGPTKTPPAPCNEKAKAIYFGTQSVLHHLTNPRTAKFGGTAAVCEVAGSLDKYLTKGYVDAKNWMGVEKQQRDGSREAAHLLCESAQGPFG